LHKQELFYDRLMIRKILIFSIYALFCCNACSPSGFDLEVQLSSAVGDKEPIKDGTVQVQFGQAEPLSPQEVDAKGRAFFKEISPEFEKDSIRLLYQPVVQRRWRITEQYPYTAAENKIIKFTIDFPPDNTSFMWSLRDKNDEGIVGATITFDGKYIIKTGSNGYFNITLPKPAGEKARFLIEKDGKVLMDKNVAIYPEYRRLYIE